MNLLDDQMLDAIFKQFDTDDSGVITKDNIIAAMNKIGHQITQQELDQIMEEHDSNQSGDICFHQFKNIFYDIQGNGP